MRNWAARVPVACQNCGSIYIATPTEDGEYRVTVTDCQHCGEGTFDPVER